jgi:hypothetical protein
LFLQRDRRDLLGHREHHMEVLDRQQVLGPILEPLRLPRALTLRAMPVAATVVGDALVVAVVARLDVAAELCRAAGEQRAHDAAPGRRDLALLQQDVTKVADHVGHLEGGPRHGSRQLGIASRSTALFAASSNRPVTCT